MKLENPQVDEPVPAADEIDNEAPEGADPKTADPAPAATPSDSTVGKTVQGRIDEITRKRREAERRADARERENESLRRELDQMRQGSRPRDSAPEQATQAPLKTLADFEFDEAKFSAYLFEQAETRAEKRAVEAAKKLLTENESKQAQQKRISTFKQREREFSKQNPDYFDVAYDQSLPFNDVIVEVASESEEGPAILFYLANNTDIADNISQLSPYAAAREIGRIEAMLVAERKKPPERVASKAPPPVPKIEGSADAALPKSLDDPNLSDAEYNKLRRKQIAARRK